VRAERASRDSLKRREKKKEKKQEKNIRRNNRGKRLKFNPNYFRSNLF
jgi:hypothetical protein